ncbi:MAG: hypothetical protein ACRDRU_00980 [Pseudonocardiaceae bacterium]
MDDDGQLTLLIDLRQIGSNGGLYPDTAEGFSLRASQLLIDVLEEIHDRLLDIALEIDAFSGMLDHLDALAKAATQVSVEDPSSDRKKRRLNEEPISSEI